MCNLYSLTKGQSAIRDLFRASRDRAGNLPLLPAIFPDQLAPIVRVGADGERELVDGALGHAGAAAIRRRANHQYPQREEPALATLARANEPLRRSGDVLLRIRRHQAAQNADVVRAWRGSAAVRLCRSVDAVARRARPKERPRRGRS